MENISRREFLALCLAIVASPILKASPIGTGLGVFDRKSSATKRGGPEKKGASKAKAKRPKGVAKVEAANCIGCGKCARICPRETIFMIERPATSPGNGRMLAVVDPVNCIGCGRCLEVCPAVSKAIGIVSPKG